MSQLFKCLLSAWIEKERHLENCMQFSSLPLCNICQIEKYFVFSGIGQFWDFGLFCIHTIRLFEWKPIKDIFFFFFFLHLVFVNFSYNTYLYRLFSQNDFFSPLQQHLHTPNFTVLFLSRFLQRSLFIYNFAWFI